MNDSMVALERMTPTDKRKIFAAIAKEFVAEHGPTMIPIQDDDSMIGMFFPCESKGEILPSELRSPYPDEIRERAKTADRSLSLEEFMNRFEEDAAAEH